MNMFYPNLCYNEVCYEVRSGLSFRNLVRHGITLSMLCARRIVCAVYQIFKDMRKLIKPPCNYVSAVNFLSIDVIFWPF